MGSGQVLQEPYPFQKARTVLREMTGQLALDLVDKGLVTNQLVLTVGYDRESLENPKIGYRGEITTDAYGRKVPKHAHGTENLTSYTSSSKELVEAATALFDRIVNPKLLVRRFYMAATHVVEEGIVPAQFQQLDLFSDPEEVTRQEAAAKAERERGAQAPGGYAFHQEEVWEERHPGGYQLHRGRHRPGAQRDHWRA